MASLASKWSGISPNTSHLYAAGVSGEAGAMGGEEGKAEDDENLEDGEEIVGQRRINSSHEDCPRSWRPYARRS